MSEIKKFSAEFASKYWCMPLSEFAVLSPDVFVVTTAQVYPDDAWAKVIGGPCDMMPAREITFQATT